MPPVVPRVQARATDSCKICALLFICLTAHCRVCVCVCISVCECVHQCACVWGMRLFVVIPKIEHTKQLLCNICADMAQSSEKKEAKH